MTRFKRTTFKELCGHAATTSAVRLQRRIRQANGVAKLATTSRDRRTAYAAKHAAINHGLATGLLNARSDEKGRHHLILVGTRNHRVHIPIHRLTPTSRDTQQVLAVLGIQTRDAA